MKISFLLKLILLIVLGIVGYYIKYMGGSLNHEIKCLLYYFTLTINGFGFIRNWKEYWYGTSINPDEPPYVLSVFHIILIYIGVWGLKQEKISITCALLTCLALFVIFIRKILCFLRNHSEYCSKKIASAFIAA